MTGFIVSIPFNRSIFRPHDGKAADHPLDHYRRATWDGLGIARLGGIRHPPALSHEGYLADAIAGDRRNDFGGRAHNVLQPHLRRALWPDQEIAEREMGN